MHPTKISSILRKVYEAGWSDGVDGVIHDNLYLHSDKVFEAYLEAVGLFLEAIDVDPEPLKADMISRRAKHLEGEEVKDE